MSVGTRFRRAAFLRWAGASCIGSLHGCKSRDELRDSVVISPSGNAAQAITTALAQGQRVYLMAGATYALDEPIWIPTGAELIGDADDPPRLVPMESFGAPEGHDDPANALLRGWAEVEASSLITAKALKAARTCQVANPDLFEVGQWIRISGANIGSDSAAAGDGSAVIKREIAEVTGVFGSSIELSAPLSQTHGVGSLVEIIEPLLDVRIVHVALVGENRTTATGLFLADASGFTVDVSVEHFSRSGVEALGSRDGAANVRGLGGCNSVLFLDSVSDSQASVQTASGRLRTHPEGIPRGLVTMRRRCSGVVLADSRLEGGCTGVSVWGGTAITIRDCEIRDMRLHERAARDPEIPRDSWGDARSAAGLEVDGFMSPSANSEFGFGLAIRDVLLEDCRHTSYTSQGAVLIVDQYGFTIDGLSIVNVGTYASTGSNWMCGLTLADTFDGSIDNLLIRGVAAPIRFLGGWVRCDFGKVEIEMADGLGDNYTATILLECGSTGSQPTSIYFDELSCAVTGNLLSVGGEFTAEAAKGLRIGALKANLWEYTDVMMALNTTSLPFPMGGVAELAVGPGTAAGLTEPTHVDTHDKVIVINGQGLGFASGMGWLCVARGNAVAVRVGASAAVAPGDGLAVEVGSRALTVGGSPFLGVALESRPAESTKLVKMTRS